LIQRPIQPVELWQSFVKETPAIAVQHAFPTYSIIIG